MKLCITGCVIAVLTMSGTANAQPCPGDTAYSSRSITTKVNPTKMRAEAVSSQTHVNELVGCTGTLKNRVKLDPVIDWGSLVNGFHQTSGAGVEKDDCAVGDYRAYGEHHIDGSLQSQTVGKSVPVCSASERNSCNAEPGNMWREDLCWCETLTPIIVDVRGDGYALVGADHGVVFDILPGGAPERISWTSPGSDDAFLVLDRNGDGVVNDGEELFGNFTPQPESPEKNGFEALAIFDNIDNGGNSDGRVSNGDGIFQRLRLWTDNNHDGVSQSWELQSLAAAGISEIDLAYRTLQRRDANGNVFRYRSNVLIGLRDSWVYDVILVRWRDTWSSDR